MQHMNVSGTALVGLYVAHRAYDAKGSANIRAMVDAERVLLGGKSPLLKTDALPPGPESKPGETEYRIVPSHGDGAIEIALENHVYEHFQRALTHAQDGGLFGYKKGQYNPQLSVDTEDALKTAEKRDAPAVPPKIVEGGKKKSG